MLQFRDRLALAVFRNRSVPRDLNLLNRDNLLTDMFPRSAGLGPNPAALGRAALRASSLLVL